MKYKAGAIIACLDAQMTAPGPEFGYDGKSVMIQPEMEEFIHFKGSPKGTVVFWVSDHEYNQAEFAQLSARCAWNMARHIRECSKASQTIILYNEAMSIPLSASERALNRQLGIMWVPYDKAVRPTVQADFITFCSTDDHGDHQADRWQYW